MAYVKVVCPYCKSENVTRFGKTKDGRQKYACKNPECPRKTFLLSYANTAWTPGMKERIVSMVMNGSGTRDTARVLGVSKDTVTKVLRDLKDYVEPVNKEFLDGLDPESTLDIVVTSPFDASAGQAGPDPAMPSPNAEKKTN